MKLILPVEVASEISPHLPPSVAVVRVDSEGNLDGDATDAEVYLSWFNLKVTTLHKVLAVSPALRWHHAPNAGVDRFLTPTYLERDLILTNGAGVHAIPIAESVIGYMLAHTKRLSELYALQAEHHWKSHFAIQELKGATLLIIGAGGIGQEIALRARAFGMRILGSRRRPEPLPHFDKVVGADEWRSLLPEADYVVIATPLTPETKGSLDEAALRLMRPHAYLINIARGAIVEEPALLKALSENWIAGAALDTLITEPLPPDSPFWSLPNVLITPHCSAHSPKVAERSLALFLDNLQRYRSGIALRNVVDKRVGY
ncbi:MAG: Glyoxylate/hydroxypyruvate reductase A [Chroococcidiopsis cubana SAG 39.79]|uniref:Hydroxyacid dehydrogenase n=1 Tax=Chroococcidiopsis cubana SAG 39.79 TaxID=388085 RepID=A0AB37UFP7_9CYAN|nr:D-2-hydroxyacid dehydrogenase [Chroococcidiopsis cubana]MDZ4876595.1 Glyoxylate/hydroxypyruvate reductase A [Chroococcidiopsis cubana SAG 39.79]PSB59663.1 D-2-hydroxyacid dehydrogenase [Chroococcidiopsis cubana CCALA 043]RUT10343.1 hydroxyacid dehydrogenase [Chroococcidiopsis cubana SAG 39.79]